MGFVRAGLAIAILAILTIVLMPLQILATRWHWKLASRLPHVWQRVAARLLGVRVRVTGTPARPPLMLASNHVSWLDIVVLSVALPVSFIAKSEVAGWPVFGTLARLQRTIFVEREKRARTVEVGEHIAARVDRGDVMVLFAEGTTGDGIHLKSFKSALIGAAGAAVAGDEPITVQPVAVIYSGIHGLPLGHQDWPLIAWYGDMEMVPHFLRLASLGAIDATVSFGAPIRFAPDTDRKTVTRICHDAVRDMIRQRRKAPSSP
ncbi:MAG: 1-acyl-sn-glycerol-3-phosphate acyltransferase [Bauldia sp.]